MRGFDFRPIDPKDIPARQGGQRGSRYLSTIGEFMKSGSQAVVLDPDTTKPSIFSAGLRASIKKAGLAGKVDAFARGDHVYLVRVTS